MRARVVAIVCTVLIFTIGGVVWLFLSDGPGRPGAEPLDSEPSKGGKRSVVGPSATESPLPKVGGSARVCDCASRPQKPGAFWGMHVMSPIGDDFPDAPIGAVNLTTSQVYWNQVETAPGQYDFSRLDDIVATSEDRQAQPMVVLGFTPPSMRRSRSPRPPAATMPDEAAWRAWVSAVVERYGDRLDYQVWPEPNIVSNWAGTPAQMGRLTAIAGEIIHDRAPDALVVAPATTLRLKSQRQWMSRFWATEVAGVPVADRVDAVALDPFPLEDGTPEDALDLICQAREILAKHGVDLPVWTNEINYGVPSGGTAGVKPYPDTQQAAVVARTYLLHAAMGIDRVYWLGWFSYEALAVEMVRDGVTTPAARAYSTVHGWLAGAGRPACLVDEGLHTCVVKRDRDVLRIIWRERGTSRVTATDGETRVQNVAGERRRLGEGDVVRVGQSPVAIVEPDPS